MRGYRALLWLYPASFRHEYGDEMCRVFADRRRASLGWTSRAALWIETVADVLTSAARVQWDITRQDLRYARRALGRAPGFAAAAVLVAATGIGATTTAFSLADHVLVRPLPFPDADRLVDLWQNDSPGGSSEMELSPANLRDWRDRSSTFAGIASDWVMARNLIGAGAPERVEGALVSGNLFDVLGVHPAVGRAFDAADDRPGAPATVILSDRFWRSHFGGDPGIIGRTLSLDGVIYTVVGVMPASFGFPRPTVMFWEPERFDATWYEDRTNTFLSVVARLAPGVGVAAARADLGRITADLARTFPDTNRNLRATVVPLRDDRVEISQRSRTLLLTLVGASLCLLLLACSNLASLLLTRALVRERELAVRTALGAGRDRLMRQMLTENLVLAGAGGLLGSVLGIWATPLLASLAPNALPIATLPQVDLRLLLIAAVTTAATGVAFGVGPALRARSEGATALRDGARAGASRRTERLRASLVVVQVAMSVVLLASTGLLARALVRVEDVNPGFDARHVLTMRTQLPWPQYAPTATRTAFYTRVTTGILALPGVTEAAYTSGLPMVVRGGIWAVTLAGHPADPTSGNVASLRCVTPGVFAALGIPLLEGRDIRMSDTIAAPPVAVVSRSFVRLNFPGASAIGRQFDFAFRTRTIVGVVGDVRVRGLERASEPQVYLSAQQIPDGWMSTAAPKDLVVRSTLPPETLIPAIRRLVAQADPDEAVSDVQTLADVVAADTAPRRVQVVVLAGFAAMAMLLAAIGLHGLLSFIVSSGRREIGVRLALGAQARQVFGLVVGKSAVLAGIGVTIGGAAAFGAGRSLQSILAGVSPADPVTFAAAILLSVVLVVAGTALPAFRAVCISPLEAMRGE